MKHIEDTWPKKFKDEVQSLRLNIVMDGVNLYSLQNNNYSIWKLQNLDYPKYHKTMVNILNPNGDPSSRREMNEECKKVAKGQGINSEGY